MPLTACLMVLIAVAAKVSGETTSGKGVESRRRAEGVMIYKSKSKFDMTFSKEEELLSTSEVFGFESVSAEYFHHLLTASQVVGRDILTTDVNVEDQTVKGGGGDVFTSDGAVTLKSSVVVTYTGEDSISDLASVLSMIVREKQGAVLLDLLISDGVVGAVATSAKIAFSTPENPSVAESLVTVTPEFGSLKQVESEKKSAVVVCVVLAFCLLGVSLVLFFVVGGFKGCSFGKRNLSYAGKRVDDDSRAYDGSCDGRLGAKPSTEDDEENIPPNSITMHSSTKDSRNGLTPRRREDTSSVLTPLSLADESNLSNIADQSVTSARPLGIRSMSKLKRTLTPQKDQHTVAIQISKILD